MNYIILSEKTWNANLRENMAQRFPNHNWVWINNKEAFTLNQLDTLKPDKIFIPHWSYIISEAIYTKYDCVVFHMTDVPYGRGGSPLQNLIINGLTQTKISALKVCRELDAGDVYLKKEMPLSGTAEEIYLRANHIIEEMMAEIVERNPLPKPQTGGPVVFKRRTPEESNIAALSTSKEIYDYIRMLDAEGYPHAFVEVGNLRLEFTHASLNDNDTVKAEVIIKKKH